MEKLFTRHPAPWSIDYGAAECGNGSSIDLIKDADGETVASSYNSGFDELWEIYGVLTDDQKKELGQGEFSIVKFNNSVSYTEPNHIDGYCLERKNGWRGQYKMDYWEAYDMIGIGYGEANTPYEALQKAKGNQCL